MDDRTKTFFSFLTVAGTLVATGCGINQPAKFQMSFLPRELYAGLDTDHVPPPKVAANPYLEHIPAVLIATPAPPKARTRGEVVMQDAEHAFQRGRRAYQSNDFDTARREFDSA